MAWTVPMTFVDGAVLTASQMNTHLRDNLMETMPAKCTQASQYFVGAGANRIIARKAAKNTVNTQETTDSSSYTDLATIGPSVTIETGTSVQLFYGCQMKLSQVNQTGYASVRVTSAGTDADATVQGNTSNSGNSIEPDDSYSVVCDGTFSTVGDELCTSLHMTFLDTLTPGLNTFTMQYRSGRGGSITFFRRRISVMSLD